MITRMKACMSCCEQKTTVNTPTKTKSCYEHSTISVVSKNHTLFSKCWPLVGFMRSCTDFRFSATYIFYWRPVNFYQDENINHYLILFSFYSGVKNKIKINAKFFDKQIFQSPDPSIIKQATA